MKDILEHFWKNFVDGFYTIAINFLSLIPVPDFMSNLSSYASALAPVSYWLGVLRVDIGVMMLFGAYAIRFAIRRIPFIG